MRDHREESDRAAGRKPPKGLPSGGPSNLKGASKSLGKLLGQDLSQMSVDGIPLDTAKLLDMQAPLTDHDNHLMVRRMQEELMGALLAIQEAICCGLIHVAQMANHLTDGQVVDCVVLKPDADGKPKAHPNRFAAMGHINAMIKAGRTVHVMIVKDHNAHANHQPYLDQIRELMKWSAWEKPTDGEKPAGKIQTPEGGPSSN